MFDFLTGLKTLLVSKTLKKDQVMFCQDTGELLLDIKNDSTEQTTRYVVRDPLAAQLDGETLLIL